MNGKEERQKYKNEVAKRHFRYNRYLLLRYSLAILFFSNIYWGLALLLDQKRAVLLPLGLLVLSLGAISEHVKLYNQKEQAPPRLQLNFYYHLIQLGANLFLLGLTFLTFDFTKLFPFFTNSSQARGLLLTLLLTGSLLSLLCLRRMRLIHQNKDKHYGYIKEYEKAFK